MIGSPSVVLLPRKLNVGGGEGSVTSVRPARRVSVGRPL